MVAMAFGAYSKSDLVFSFTLSHFTILSEYDYASYILVDLSI